MASHDVPIGANQVSLAALNERSREIFRHIVESYLATGEPVGSRNLARLLPITLSPASVRNVMSDLEQLGLIFAPHTSAGRLPTEPVSYTHLCTAPDCRCNCARPDPRKTPPRAA